MGFTQMSTSTQTISNHSYLPVFTSIIAKFCHTIAKIVLHFKAFLSLLVFHRYVLRELKTIWSSTLVAVAQRPAFRGLGIQSIGVLLLTLLQAVSFELRNRTSITSFCCRIKTSYFLCSGSSHSR